MDGRTPELKQNMTLGMLPGSLQVQLKVLAEQLGVMLDGLGVVEDCFSVGGVARVLADQVVATVGHRPTRKLSTGKLSLVFVDRTLDVFGATSFDRTNTASLLLNTAPELFAGSNDVRIDLRRLFNKSDTEFMVNGCLADSRSAIPIARLMRTDHVTLADQVLSSLEDQVLNLVKLLIIIIIKTVYIVKHWGSFIGADMHAHLAGCRGSWSSEQECFVVM